MSSLGTISATLGGALVLLASAATAQAAPSSCPDADEVVVAEAVDRAAAVVGCVIDEERAKRGRPRLREQGQLERAAERHARDMVRRRYFSHTTPEGRTFDERLQPYTRGFEWTVGETLGWGRRSGATPEQIVRAWLASPSHRRVLLDPDYRDVGIGVAPGLPLSTDPGATFAVDYGLRR
jgi:uncharacterized protein YkwD